MPTCDIKKSKFVQQDCTTEAIGQCKQCNKWLCETHNATHDPNDIICVDCYGQDKMVKDYELGNLCKIKKGFFILQDCSEKAIGKCSECNTWVCTKHDIGKEVIMCGACFMEKTPQTYDYSPNADQQLTDKWYETLRRNVWIKVEHEPFIPEDYEAFNNRFIYMDMDDQLSDNFFDS